MIKVKRALISVCDKKGLASFAKGLASLGIEIISTGGTARHLRESGIPVVEVSDYTGFPEILDGRVKTLHPKIHAGLLALRENEEHTKQLQAHHIGFIDMVVINLYPFQSVIEKKNVSLAEALENIDIGGPSMLRSAAKNFKSVAVVCNPVRYGEVLKELENNNALLSDSVLFNLAAEAFGHTAHYDQVISRFFLQRKSPKGFSSLDALPQEFELRFKKVQDLRYGENPHQKGAFYRDMEGAYGLANIKQLHGKELSFNNILDLNAAVELIKELNAPAAAIVKHGNPTGIAQDKSLSEAYLKAWRCDPTSAFGGIIGLNRKVDSKTAQAIIKSGFMECVIAPQFDQSALKLLKTKKNLRLIELNFNNFKENNFDFKKVQGGLLLQERDQHSLAEKDLKLVTKKRPASSELVSLLFGWKIIKNIKSNAILLIKGTRTAGVGCGQTSRVDSLRLAIQRAGKNARGSVLISDAFLPNVDNVQLAAKAGIKAIIQPGGSIVDEDVIKESNKAKIAMVLTGVRHFRH